MKSYTITAERVRAESLPVLEPQSLVDVDRRDMRDPSEVGKELLGMRELYCSREDHPSDCSLSRVHNFVEQRLAERRRR